MMLQNHIYHYSKRFELESGDYLPGFQLFYSTYGRLNADKTNVIWVCHALTANSNFVEWWPGMFGPEYLYNPDEYFVVCANMLGGCYGSTGPLSLNPETGKPYYHRFPKLTNRDIVGAFDLLRESLGIDRIHTIIGGSMGGQHAIEWNVQKPELFDRLIGVATNAQHSPWGIAFNETQRMAIEQDPTWQEENDKAGLNGMKTARAVALISYRHYQTYGSTQKEENIDKEGNYRASSYQRYQGEKLARRFNAFTYWTLSEAMDSHNVARNRGDFKQALSRIKAKSHFIGIQSDVLFPTGEQEFLARNVPKASLELVDSLFGHDGFLIETDLLTESIRKLYAEEAIAYLSTLAS